MSSSAWTIYHQETGVIRACYIGPEATVTEQLREGEAAIPGQYDPGAHRINPTTHEAERIEPPGPDYRWDERGGRYLLTPEAAAQRAAQRNALARISALEADQARPIREYILGMPGAKDRLTAIDSEIAALRGKL